MTNTKFRKRALISSVAMLLVALVALGSATFAWFSQNSRATANNITAKTRQGSNIVVSEDGSTWAQDINFAGSNIVPNTSFYTPVTPGGNALLAEPTTVDMTHLNWKTTTANGIDTGVQGTGREWTNATAGTNFSQTDLYVKYDATEGTKEVTISFTANGTGMDDFLRVALVPADGASGATTTLFEEAKVWGEQADDFALDPAAFTTLDASNTGKTITNTTDKILYTSKALTAGVAYHFSVYVWFEGTDPQCIDANAATNFDIDFAIAAAA